MNLVINAKYIMNILTKNYCNWTTGFRLLLIINKNL